MTTKAKRLWLLAAVVSVTITAGGVYYFDKPNSSPPAAVNPEGEGGDLYYCPMHPQHRSHEAGNCPICSMKLVKLGSNGSEPQTAEKPAGGGVYIAPERQQLIGVKSVAVEKRPLTKEIRTVGRVAYDETKITHIHSKVAGFIEEVFVDYVGRTVRRGEPLFTIYSPDLVATQQEYLLALRSNAILKDSAFSWVAGGSNDLLESVRQRLLLWDVTPGEIEALARDGKVKRAIAIHSPVNGVVTERQAYHHGRYVTPDLDLYTIVDLSTVWVLGEAYEHDLPLLKVGQTAEIEFPYASNLNRRRGKIVFISPTLDPKTRTAEVRLEFPNPDLTLRPDMFVNFTSRVYMGRQLVAPVDAVLDGGTSHYVFVDKGAGYFEPRSIEVGARTEDYVAIVRGLTAGDKVVTAANFIIDSESRLKGALAGMGAPGAVPIGGTFAAGPSMSVEVLEPKTAKVGRNTIRLALNDASGRPIEDAQVEVSLFMPRMGTMPPMTSKAELKHEGGGVYFGTIEALMAWTWETTVTARRNGQVVGTAKTSITAR